MNDLAISVRGLCKSFGGLQVLDNVSFDVKCGEIISIIGASGTGKSVLLRCMELLTPPDRGTVVLNGQEITARGANVDQIHRNIGMVYQNFNLFSHLNVLDNLCLAPVKLLGMSRGDAVIKARGLLEQVGLLSKEKAMPASLSGGQKQRIAIARCLMMDPKIMLFDEPTSALDPNMTGEVLATIRMLAKRGMTMMIVTHEMNFAHEISDRVFFMADKGIYEEGKPSEVMDAPRKEKTIAFMRRIKTFEFDINSPDFDLMALQGGIRNFAEKYGLSNLQSYVLQICNEELIYEFIGHSKSIGEPIDIRSVIEYSEKDQGIEFTLFCRGASWNVFDQDIGEEAHLGLVIVEHKASRYSTAYKDGANVVNVLL